MLLVQRFPFYLGGGWRGVTLPNLLLYESLVSQELVLNSVGQHSNIVFPAEVESFHESLDFPWL